MRSLQEEKQKIPATSFGPMKRDFEHNKIVIGSYTNEGDVVHCGYFCTKPITFTCNSFFPDFDFQRTTNNFIHTDKRNINILSCQDESAEYKKIYTIEEKEIFSSICTAKNGNFAATTDNFVKIYDPAGKHLLDIENKDFLIGVKYMDKHNTYCAMDSTTLSFYSKEGELVDTYENKINHEIISDVCCDENGCIYFIVSAFLMHEFQYSELRFYDGIKAETIYRTENSRLMCLVANSIDNLVVQERDKNLANKENFLCFFS